MRSRVLQNLKIPFGKLKKNQEEALNAEINCFHDSFWESYFMTKWNFVIYWFMLWSSNYIENRCPKPPSVHFQSIFLHMQHSIFSAHTFGLAVVFFMPCNMHNTLFIFGNSSEKVMRCNSGLLFFKPSKIPRALDVYQDFEWHQKWKLEL